MSPRLSPAAPMRVRWLLAAWLLLALLPTQAIAQDAAATPPPPTRTLLVMGDSLSAGYGMAANEGWVDLLADRLRGSHPGWTVVNASISGETSAGGSARIVDEVVRHRPGVVVIALGANDGLRGLPLREMRRNLARMIGAAQFVGADVLLVGMRMPPNLGADYTRGFEAVYHDLAKLFDVELVPFLLEPVAMDRGSFQPDNLHPTARVQPALRDHVWASLAPMVQRAEASMLD
ncbi:arylesterase [Luteimonas yindakuii]|nr:arylesterase [Luteimonas yindakuii]